MLDTLAAALWDKWGCQLVGRQRRYKDLLPEERAKVMDGVRIILNELLTPTTSMILAACAEAAKEQCRPVSINRTDAAMVWETMLKDVMK